MKATLLFYTAIVFSSYVISDQHLSNDSHIREIYRALKSENKIIYKHTYNKNNAQIKDLDSNLNNLDKIISKILDSGSSRSNQDAISILSEKIRNLLISSLFTHGKSFPVHHEEVLKNLAEKLTEKFETLNILNEFPSQENIHSLFDNQFSDKAQTSKIIDENPTNEYIKSDFELMGEKEEYLSTSNNTIPEDPLNTLPLKDIETLKIEKSNVQEELNIEKMVHRLKTKTIIVLYIDFLHEIWSKFFKIRNLSLESDIKDISIHKKSFLTYMLAKELKFFNQAYLKRLSKNFLKFKQSQMAKFNNSFFQTQAQIKDIFRCKSLLVNKYAKIVFNLDFSRSISVSDIITFLLNMKNRDLASRIYNQINFEKQTYNISDLKEPLRFNIESFEEKLKYFRSNTDWLRLDIFCKNFFCYDTKDKCIATNPKIYEAYFANNQKNYLIQCAIVSSKYNLDNIFNSYLLELAIKKQNNANINISAISILKSNFLLNEKLNPIFYDYFTLKTILKMFFDTESTPLTENDILESEENDKFQKGISLLTSKLDRLREEIPNTDLFFEKSKSIIKQFNLEFQTSLDFSFPTILKNIQARTDQCLESLNACETMNKILFYEVLFCQTIMKATISTFYFIHRDLEVISKTILFDNQNRIINLYDFNLSHIKYIPECHESFDDNNDDHQYYPSCREFSIKNNLKYFFSSQHDDFILFFPPLKLSTEKQNQFELTIKELFDNMMDLNEFFKLFSDKKKTLYLAKDNLLSGLLVKLKCTKSLPLEQFCALILSNSTTIKEFYSQLPEDIRIDVYIGLNSIFLISSPDKRKRVYIFQDEKNTENSEVGFLVQCVRESLRDMKEEKDFVFDVSTPISTKNIFAGDNVAFTPGDFMEDFH